MLFCVEALAIIELLVSIVSLYAGFNRITTTFLIIFILVIYTYILQKKVNIPKMSNKREGKVLFLLLIIFLVAALYSQPITYTEMLPHKITSDLGYEVTFPGLPKEVVETADTGLGREGFEIYQYSGNGIFYEVAVSDKLGLDYGNVSLSKKLLEMSDRFLVSGKKESVERHPILLGGYEGLEVKYSEGVIISVIRLFIVDDKFYEITARYYRTNTNNTEIQKFLESFTFS